ncbi:MAG: carboxymuconolactone decarboxylase family protein [Actinomycetota bacterium]|nr:MAG: carboxymuconolactone decarboxylase family protein [Actinomycetota bacterium]
MMQRLKNPGVILPEATKAIQDLVKATMSAGLPSQTMDLVHLRTSQINGCSFCVNSTMETAKKAAGFDEQLFSQLFSVPAWRETPWFNDAERAALALAEAMTRLCDRADPVPDEVWDEAARHYDERQLAALVLWIATTNLFNRINVTVRQSAGQAPWE